MDTRMAQDFYELIGVARDADAAEIKRAYRKKARELHPDVSDEPDAEERFRRVSEAYEVLSDDQRRATYDRYGEEGLKSGGWESQFSNFGSIADIFGAFFGGEDPFGSGAGRGGAQAGRGEDVHLAVDLKFREAILGAERELTFTAPGTCETCDGSGAADPSAVATCETCNGHGAVRQVSRSIFGQVVQERACPRCAGRGRVVTDPCGTCAGTGERAEARTVSIGVPAGIQDGQRIRLTGRGGVGQNGEGPSGNLYVDINVEADERFLREGDDLITVLDLPITTAALGASLPVPTVDGDARILEIPAGTQPGTRMVIRGLGSGRLRGGSADGTLDRGDLIVYCNVRVPKELAPEQRDALARFQALEDDRNYREREGLFDKLRRMVKP